MFEEPHVELSCKFFTDYIISLLVIANSDYLFLLAYQSCQIAWEADIEDDQFR